MFWWNEVIAQVSQFFENAGADTLTVMAIAIGIWLVTSTMLGFIFAKTRQPFIAAFIPIWNIITIYRLGGYSALWVVGSIIASAIIAYAPVSLGAALLARFGGDAAEVESADSTATIFNLLAIPSALYLFCFLLVGILAIYNIGRGFGKDAGFLLLAVILPFFWLLSLSISGDWDVDEAHPNSSGSPRQKFRKPPRKARGKTPGKQKSFLDDNTDDNFVIVDSGSATKGTFDGTNWS